MLVTMNRFLAPLLLLTSSWILASAAQAQEMAPPSAPAPAAVSSALPALPKIDYVVRGKDFHVLAKPQRATPGRTEMLVFFWYGSPWAAKIDPYLRAWIASGRAPANLRIQYVPMAMSDQWTFAARVFYALEELGMERELTPRLLRAVELKVVDLSSPASVQKWLLEQGVSPEAFEKAINSNRVVAKTASLPAIASAYQVRSSPTFIIDGTYHIAATRELPPERAAAVAMFFAQKLSEGGPRP
jgi:thiol:disulfide interchange protein DsbA